MNLRILRLLAVLLTVIGLLAACGGDEGTDTTAATTATSTSDDIRAYEGTTIRIALEDIDSTASLMQVIDEFTELTGINVEVETYDEATLRQKLILDFTSHTKTYDVVELQYWFVPEFANAGFLMPLDDLLASDLVPGWVDVDDYPGATFTSMQYDGVTYGLPVRLIGALYYYRTDLFAEQGWDVPTTTDEILEIAQATEEAYGNELVGWSGRGDRDFGSFGSFGGWAAAYGARLFDDDMRPTLVSDPAWTDAITDWVTLMTEYSSPGAGNFSWYEVQQEFLVGLNTQQIETSDNGPYFENPTDSDVADVVGYAAAPVGPGGKTVQWFFSGGYAINNDIDQEKKDAAWLFLQWRSSAGTFAKELTVEDNPRFAVPSVSVLESEAYVEAARAAGLEEYAEGQREAFLAMDPWYWPFIPEFIQVAEAFATNVSATIAGQMTVEEALQNSNDQIEVIMEEAGYYE